MITPAKKKQYGGYKNPDARGDDYDLDELPGHVTDEYQQDPYQQISKVKYLNMMISHAISINDELKFMKLMQKLKYVTLNTQEDQMLKTNLDLLQDKPYAEVR